METIVNKVAGSGLITLDLESLHDNAERVAFDIKDHLYMGLMLKEKEFRDFVKDNNWEAYRGKHVAMFCSSDAIVPTWAYMLIAGKLNGVAASYVFGTMELLEFNCYKDAIDALDMESYRDQRVVVKGCSKREVPVSAYVYLSSKLLPLVKSLMYGEPCSTVPVYKKS